MIKMTELAGGKEHTMGRWIIALALTVLFHIGALQGFPAIFALAPIPERSNEIEIEIVQIPVDEQFVEVNEVAPENIPDETSNYSFQDQQAATPELAEETTENVPKIKDGEEEAHKIVQGKVRLDEQSEMTGLFDDIEDSNADQPESGVPAMPKPSQQEQEAIVSKGGEGVSLPEIEGIEEETDQNSPKILDITPLEETEEFVTTLTPSPIESKTPKPRPRPRIDLSKVSGPIRNSDISASRRGVVSIDAKFSQFGEYQQRMFEAIVYQWYKLAERITLGAGDVPSEVEIFFYVNREGQVVGLKQKRSSAGYLSSFICEDAIKSRAPYGVWTEAMVASLGEKTEVTITFNYR